MAGLEQATDGQVAIIKLADGIARGTTVGVDNTVAKGFEVEYLVRFRAAYNHLHHTVMSRHSVDEGKVEIDDVLGKKG